MIQKEIELIPVERKELTPINEIDIDIEKITNFYQKIDQIKKEILIENVDYIKDDKGNTFMKYSGFCKFKKIFGIIIRITNLEKKEEKIIKENKEYRVITYYCDVVATSRDGDYSENSGICSSKEGKEFKRGEHDIKATAITRAKCRVIRDLIGGNVSFEELEADIPEKEVKKGAIVIGKKTKEKKSKIKLNY